MEDNQNQRKYQRIRQITPQEVAKAQGITVEEFQKTQVLNLKAVEAAVRFEKLTSKKPAFIVGIIGIMFILFGTSFQIATAFQSSSKNVVEKRKVSLKEEIIKKNEKLQCQQLSSQDGINKDYIILYHFKENKLIGFEKTMIVTSSDSKMVDSYNEYYKTRLNETDGYSIKLDKVDSGVKVIVRVDYDKLDLMKLNSIQQQHYSTKVDYPMDTTYNRIKTDMINDSFICQ